MVKKPDRQVENGKEVVADKKKVRSVEIASSGIRTAEAGGLFCEAMIRDILEDSVPYQRANAALRAYGSLLRTVDMNQRYGKENQHGKSLDLLPQKNSERSGS